MGKKAKIVQIRHPRTGLYVRINREKGIITGHKMSVGPYKGIPITRKKRRWTWLRREGEE